jgi:hypothetical protein
MTSLVNVMSQRNNIFPLKEHSHTIYAVPSLVTSYYNNSAKYHLKLQEISVAHQKTIFE